jgi:hypothetical protein
MIDLQIDLHGIELPIHYQMYEGYIEWRIRIQHYPPTPFDELMFTMVRMHYTTFIESIIKEHYHWKMEEEARATPPDEPPF